MSKILTIFANTDVIYKKIVERIPLGFKTHKEHQSLKIDLPKTEFADYVLQTTGLKQLGTLGGGNHFIELGYGADERGWIVIHSGSRGFGHKIASHYMQEAYNMKNPSNEKAFEEAMCGIRGTVDENTLDESPFAYKDIFEVMRLQDDLLELEEHIKVLINVKDNAKSRF